MPRRRHETEKAAAEGPVLGLAPVKPVPSQHPDLAKEERTFVARYLRLADAVLKDSGSGKAQAKGTLGDIMEGTKVKVAKYDPLTFACVACGQEFSAADKMLNQLSKEVTDHITREHSLQHPRAERNAA